MGDLEVVGVRDEAAEAELSFALLCEDHLSRTMTASKPQFTVAFT